MAGRKRKEVPGVLSLFEEELPPSVPPEQRKEYAQLSARLRHLSKKYYQEDAPEVSDDVYDQLYQHLLALETQFPDLRQQDSVSATVGADPLPPFAKIAHLSPLFSLDNAFSEEDIVAFLSRLQRFLTSKEGDAPLDIIVEPKIDGLSVSLRYEKGVLLSAATRGNGEQGEDITQNARTIPTIPPYVPALEALPLLEVRGEIFMPKQVFTALNAQRQKEGAPLFANTRNAAAGSLRQLNPAITAERSLQFFAYALSSSLPEVPTQEHLLERLKDWGFQVAAPTALCSSSSEVFAFYRHILSQREDLAYAIDGVVLKINAFTVQERLGFSSHAPRYAIAYKFPAERVVTRLRDIQIQVGRTGALTPVALLDPVVLNGARVTRASLHNEDEIARKGLSIGDQVIVQRAGDVIPQVIDVAVAAPERQPYLFPDYCPSCGALSIRFEGESLRRCPAGLSCPAQRLERLVHFVSRKALNIERLGRRSLRFLIATGRIVSPVDLFTLEQREAQNPLAQCAGWGEVSVQALFHSINLARTVPLDRFLFALGIESVGAATARLLAEHYGSFSAFREAGRDLLSLQEDLAILSGIGPKILADIHAFFTCVENNTLLDIFASHLQIVSLAERPTSLPFSGKVIVFTGTLEHMSRAEAKTLAERLGARVSDTVTRITDYLVIGKNPGSKQAQAQRLGVSILREESWKEIGENGRKDA
ncbi:MAG: NAD-dependent DNA ligase LigA [Holosporales bacterium]|nr:NAD-dependent DNA ligase LigA [Holosporales bacterium]